MCSPSANAPTAARRSPYSKLKPRPHSSCSRAIRRRAVVGGRPRRPNGRDQRHRTADRQRDHASVDRPRRVCSATRWRRSRPRKPPSCGRGVPGVIGRQNEGPLAIIVRPAEEVCGAASASWARNGPPPRSADGWSIRMKPGCSICPRRDCLAGTSSTTRAPRLRPCGRRAWGLPAKAFELGVTKADWPARLQRLSNGKLSHFAPAGSEIWLDGGHNVDGGRMIAAALADLEERVSRPLVLIIGMLATKDAEGFLRNFTGLTRKMIALPFIRTKRCPRTRSPTLREDRHSGRRPETIEGALSHVAAPRS